MAVLAVMALGPSVLGAQTMSERCGEAVPNAPPEPQGRWLDWVADGFAGREPRPGYTPILDRLADIARPFMDSAVLDPPPGVEVRPQRVIWGESPPELGSPFPRNTLLIQVFHPSVQQAVEASAKIEVALNSPFPLFYGLAQPITEDAEGPIFVAPEQVGEVAGAPVFWSGRPRDCLVVFRTQERPLWVPVSRGRYLEALAAGVRREIASADSAYREARAETGGGDPGDELEEVIRQLRAIDPKAAAEMERQAAEMKREMERLRPRIESEADVAGAETGRGLMEQVGKIEAELAAMSPAERASQAHVAGLDGSKASLLSSPAAEGSRPLVAPNPGYFDGDASPGQVQLLVVEMASVADHAPERTIIARLWREVDWSRFSRWVRENSPAGG